MTENGIGQISETPAFINRHMVIRGFETKMTTPPFCQYI
jgi:hypothetical protein